MRKTKATSKPLDSAHMVQVSGCQTDKLDMRSARVSHDQVIGSESLGDVLVDTDLESVTVTVRLVILEIGAVQGGVVDQLERAVGAVAKACVAQR